MLGVAVRGGVGGGGGDSQLLAKLCNNIIVYISHFNTAYTITILPAVPTCK